VLLAAGWALAGAAPVVRVDGVGHDIATGKPLRLSVITPERSSAGNAAQPPLAWIDHEETIDPAAAACERRAERLLNTGPLRPAARDFNAVHVVTLDADGALHVLDPRNSIRGARSLAHIALNGPPTAWHWAAAEGLIWVALADAEQLVAVDVARWRITRTIEKVGRVTAFAQASDGTLHALAPGKGIWRLSAAGSDLIRDSEDAVHMAMGEDGEVWAIGSDAVRWIGKGETRTMAVPLQDALWSRRADRLVGLGTDGVVRMISRTGTISQVGGMPAAGPTARLWLSPASDALVVHDRRANGLHVASLERADYVRTIDADRPVSLAASNSFLFVRTEGRGETMVMSLAELARPGGGGPRWIAGGEPVSPSRPRTALAASADGLSAWADAERNLIYLYHEGMNIPSGTLRNPGPAPDRMMLVGPTILPVAPGRFEAGFQLERPGRYVAVVVGMQPRFVQCWAFAVTGAPQLADDERETRVRMASNAHQASVGETVTVRFTLDGSNLPARVGVLVMDVSGTGVQDHIAARAVGHGAFEALVPATRTGTFLVMPDPVTLPARLAGRPVATITVAK
jgi:hypothetical protein